ncbi:hypothetical protein ACHAWO_004051 [Cyclotella atomus]|uniref:Uncharacterized protein n=1 Tax=Cyclotella atomus TaxID=382360 RepID=A0ABD3N1K5_9STRA
MEPESALITKLHAKLSVFRRDRDDAHRRKELAVERSRIVKKDRENAAAEVSALKNKLAEMEEETKKKIGDVAFVEREVEKLNMEVSSSDFRFCRFRHLLNSIFIQHSLQYKFQHSELQSKREKLSHLSAKVSTASTSRTSTTKFSREALRKRRDNSSSLNAPNLSLGEKKRQLEALLDGEGAEEWMAALPDWIATRAESVWEEGDDVRRECLALEKKVRGYEAAVGSVYGMEVTVGEQ